MKTALLIIPLLMACGGTSTQQIVKDHDGRVRAEVTRLDGKKDGPVRFFGTDGNLSTSGSYSNDSRHGSWITTGPKGDTLSIVNFKRGRKDGLQGYWAANGQLLRLERFSNGEPNGPLYRFFSDGTPRQITWYVHGISNGTYTEWYKSDSTAVALTTGFFTYGKRSGMWTWIYGNGRPNAQGNYSEGRKVGVWRSWDPQGHLRGQVDHGFP